MKKEGNSMSVSFGRSHRASLFVTLLGAICVLTIFAGCGSTGTGGTGNTAPVNGKNCTKVGVLLPESASSPRWEAYDHPLLVQQLEANGFSASNIDYANANGDAGVQQTQSEADLTKGDCILIVGPHDSAAAASIVTAAKKQQVPVIAYDRFIFSDDLNYYVSFDGVAVGKLQGQYIADHYKDAQYGVGPGHNNIAFINGSPTDNNATLFAAGAHQILDPLISAGTFNKVYEQFTPNWDPPTGEKEMEAALTQTNNNIQLVLAANDGLGGAAVQALIAQKLGGKVLVTGQDATVPGLQNILEGTQAMTVYKPIVKEATAAAQVAAALRDGKSVSSLAGYATTKNPQGNASIPSVLETPEAVDKSNISSTVLADGYVTKSQLCTGLPAGTDTGGICS
jgi:D-xylose transport system substrate-binding protein